MNKLFIAFIAVMVTACDMYPDRTVPVFTKEYVELRNKLYSECLEFVSKNRDLEKDESLSILIDKCSDKSYDHARYLVKYKKAKGNENG